MDFLITPPLPFWMSIVLSSWFLFFDDGLSPPQISPWEEIDLLYKKQRVSPFFIWILLSWIEIHSFNQLFFLSLESTLEEKDFLFSSPLPFWMSIVVSFCFLFCSNSWFSLSTSLGKFPFPFKSRRFWPTNIRSENGWSEQCCCCTCCCFVWVLDLTSPFLFQLHQWLKGNPVVHYIT